jgi:hypothetical protein
MRGLWAESVSLLDPGTRYKSVSLGADVGAEEFEISVALVFTGVEDLDESDEPGAPAEPNNPEGQVLGLPVEPNEPEALGMSAGSNESKALGVPAEPDKPDKPRGPDEQGMPGMPADPCQDGRYVSCYKFDGKSSKKKRTSVLTARCNLDG